MSDLISREALKKSIKSYADDQYAENEYLGEYAIMHIIDNAPTVETFTKSELDVIADAVNYLLGAELLEENGYTEEVLNALKSVLQKIGAEEDHL